MTYLLRRLPLSRLLLLCGLVVVIGISATALAFALGTGPTPPPKPLPEAIHDAFAAGAGGDPIQGISANIQLTDHLLEGANLTGGGGEGSAGGQLLSSPLVTGGSGRMWISKDGRVRLELQSEKGDTQVLYDGHTVSIYDASSNTLYRYTVPTKPDTASGASSSSTQTHNQAGGASETIASTPDHEIPTVTKIEEAISHLTHVNISGATPTDIAGQAAYTVRVSPKETGSLIGGGELSWDASNGVPLRAAIYSSTSSSPTLELAATSISYGPVAASVFEFTPPSNARVAGNRASQEGRFVHRFVRRFLNARWRPSPRHDPRPGHHFGRGARKQAQGRRQAVRHDRRRRSAEGQDQRHRSVASCPPRSARCSASSARACATS